MRQYYKNHAADKKLSLMGLPQGLKNFNKTFE